ncbi:gamma-glutamyl-gamma-aminobutyrate hydrolase family protein [Solicola gregarius]|uniref:Gamma-glutamyl-gamma-aminobutyrate hydrolase family protein n=1 Tax=Solicola gregarius TaxID=2908642 RepID=A0AA46YNB5_9ACTN|nr:gamma-glutamyl-gamma-aminobutyrate hydrolase family protein [Solicola gregarius]UYM07316.1 gamma-glutamyl-gamma-aminobutyrate hydrolase family protein [Solicola gregarius]
MSEPIVGLSAYREDATYGVWSQRTDLLCAEYASAVERSGGVSMLLPVQDPAHAAAVVDRIDALIIAGGADVDPATYGQPPHTETVRVRPDRDAWETALLDAADERGIPVLGICRGMQVMAVRAGGSLDQHVPDHLGTTTHSPGGAGYGDVEVITHPGTLAHNILGERTTVRCHHHQAVREHPGFDVSARADDGMLEAMERPGHDFHLAVQWHPEAGSDLRLFEALVEHASATRRRP